MNILEEISSKRIEDVNKQKKIISLENAKTLLESGKTNKITGFISKNGKPFDAYLKFDENKKIIFEF